MSELTEKIDPTKNYTTLEAAKIANLEDRSVRRLAVEGHFPGAYRKTPRPTANWVIPGTALLAFLENRKPKSN